MLKMQLECNVHLGELDQHWCGLTFFKPFSFQHEMAEEGGEGEGLQKSLTP